MEQAVKTLYKIRPMRVFDESKDANIPLFEATGYLFDKVFSEVDITKFRPEIQQAIAGGFLELEPVERPKED